MLRKPDALKNLSAVLSERLNTANDLHELKRIFKQGQTLIQDPARIKPLPGNNSAKAAPKKRVISRIGIWEPKWEDGAVYFVRPAESDRWQFWADVDRISPKGDQLRVVLLGESVARGFLLDPLFNMAIALRTLLQVSGNADIEIIDLARSAQTFLGLQQLLEPALTLEPDAYILFAGNNWHIPQLELMNFEQLTATFQQTGKWGSVRAFVKETVRSQVRGFAQRLGAFSAENQIPVLFIIPDFNLRDWKAEYTWQNPLATDALIQRRLDLITEAEAALTVDNLQRAMVLAEELIELEDGLHPAGFDILAKCKLREGNVCEARRLKEDAKDLSLVYPGLQAPSCYSIIQNTLREEGPRNGITIVDLPQRFAEYLPQGLPDRRFFFDHVHMTVAGLRLAAASAVEKLLPILGRSERSWAELNQFEFHLEPRANALAHFAAACTNVTQAQDDELIHYHCAEAVRHDPQIAELMQVFLDWHIRLKPIKYVKRFEDTLERAGYRRLNFMLRSFGNLTNKALYPPLIRAITTALAESVPHIEKNIDLLLKQEHGVTCAGVDLLQSPNMELTQAPLESQWREDSNYFRSYHQDSCFHIVCDSPRPLSVRLICRIFNTMAASRPVELLVNGSIARRFLVGTQWHTWQGTIQLEFLHSGINSIVLRWPGLEQTKTERVAEMIKSLESVILWGDLMDIYSVYGEIHEFRIHT
jgi:hypothetical protein